MEVGDLVRVSRPFGRSSCAMARIRAIDEKRGRVEVQLRGHHRSEIVPIERVSLHKSRNAVRLRREN